MATYCPDEDEDREPFSCPICFEDYDLVDSRRAPKLLLCLHTFCYECTQKIWKTDGSLECSMCRMLHENVLLEELFDNPVIIQHLKKEREDQDLEFARRIDQELRNEYRPEPETVTITEEQNDITDVIEILDDTAETDGPVIELVHEEDNSSIVNVDDVPVENERNDCQQFHNFFELIPYSDSDNDEEENDDDDGSDEEVIADDQPDGEDQDNSSDDDGNEESENPVFCFNNFSPILDQDKEEDVHNENSDSEDEEVDTNEELFENPSFVLEGFPCQFGIDNEEEDDDDDDRFHSACDEISSSPWVDNELPLQEGSEDDDGDSSSFCWHILSPETLMDD